MSHMTAPRAKTIVRLACVLLAAGQAVCPAAEPGAFERIESAYAPYLDKSDPLSFPLKIKSLSANEYTFWRGSKDLFFQWCKTHCADWLADQKAFLPNHGDLHLGNIGTYASEEDAGPQHPFGTPTFGMVDFDDSTRLPFEFELLQGVITLDLVARQNKIELTDEQRDALHARLFDTYKTAVNSRRNATEMLKEDPTVAKLLGKFSKKPYGDELAKFTDGSKFMRLVIKGKKNEITDILAPVETPRWDAFSDAIAQAARNDERLAGLLKSTNAKAIRKSIKDVVRRTRLGSSGSQGLQKYLVLLEKPFKGIEHDIILYLKQEIPTAAERSGIVPPDARPPGQRCAQDMDKLTEPRALFNSWADLEGKSFWVSFKEPWSDELAFDEVKDLDQLTQMAVIWSTVVGSTHREEGRFAMILPRLNAEVCEQVKTRAAAYLDFQAEAFITFVENPRTKAAKTRADERIDR